MIRRAWMLYISSLRAAGNKIRYDFASEITIFLCCFVLLGLFFYIFDDFLNVEMARMSLVARNILAWALSWIISSVVAALTGREIAKELGSANSISLLAKRLGEDPSSIQLYLCLRLPSLVGIFLVPTLLVIFYLLVPFSLSHLFFFMSYMVIFTWLTTQVKLKYFSSPKSEGEVFSNKKWLHFKGLIGTMTAWRLLIFFARNPSSQLFYSFLCVSQPSIYSTPPVKQGSTSYLRISQAQRLLGACAFSLQKIIRAAGWKNMLESHRRIICEL